MMLYHTAIVLVASCLVAKTTGEVNFIQSLADVISVLKNENQSPSKQPLDDADSYITERAALNSAVDTTSGLVIGATFSEAHGFYSIPYAAPPVGNLRSVFNFVGASYK